MHTPLTSREKIDSHLDWAFLIAVWLAVVPVLVLGGVAGSGSRAQALTHYLIAGATALWALRLLLNPRRLVLWSPATWSGLVLGAAVAGHWLASGGLAANSAGKPGYAALFGGILLFLLTLNNLHRQMDRPVITLSLVVVGTIMATLSIVEWLRGTPWRPFGGSVLSGAAGVSGLMATPAQFSGLMALLAPVAFVIALNGRLNGVTRICLFYGGTVMVVGVFFSMSPPAWILASLLGLLLLVVIGRQYSYRRAAVMVVVAAGTALLAFLSNSLQFRYRFDEVFQQLGEPERYRVYSAAWSIWRESPWLGGGPGTMAERLAAGNPPVDLASTFLPRNDFAEALGDYGLFLTLILGGAALVTLLDGWRVWQLVKGGSGETGGKRSNRGAFLLGGLVGVLTMACICLLDSPFSLPANALAFWTLMGLLASHTRFATKGRWLELNWITRLLTVAILLSAAGGLLWLHR